MEPRGRRGFCPGTRGLSSSVLLESTARASIHVRSVSESVLLVVGNLSCLKHEDQFEVADTRMFPGQDVPKDPDHSKNQ